MKSIINKIKVFLNRYNPIAITRVIKSLEEEIKRIKKINDNSFKLIEKDIKALEKGVNVIQRDINIVLEEDIKSLELAITMAKNDHNNLQDSFNKYVLRPKCKEMIKECEDYSHERELKQQQEENIDFCLCYIDIDSLVEDVYNVCNYGNFINKNELKETITKHINLND